MAPHFSDGIRFIPLAGLTSPDELILTLAHHLRIGGHDIALKDAVVKVLDQNMLLVLDNFEHISKAAPLVGELIERTTHLKLLVTARGSLNLVDEWIFQLSGMPVDSETGSAPSLFTRHAERFDPAFKAEAGPIRELCKAVDGLPLAVELAATWVRMLTPSEILARVRRDSEFLASTQVDRPERQRSLRAVFEYSWSVLSNAAQQTLRGVSVFRGPFHISQASEVTGCNLKTLSELIDFALLLRLPDGRYQIHPLLRQFSAEKLDEATMSIPTYKAHAEAFTRYVVERGQFLAAGDPVTLTEMQDVFEDIRAAMKWLIWNRRADAIEPLLAPLSHLCRYSGLVADGLALIDQVEAMSGKMGAHELQQHARVIRESLASAPTPTYLSLTKREAEILRLMTEGLSNTQIAEVLTVEVSTVKKHVNNLFRKLNVTGREAAIQAVQSAGSVRTAGPTDTR
jgi:DNA-binding CsgD family transcriptional regulator